MRNDEKEIYNLTNDITYEDILLSCDNESNEYYNMLIHDNSLEDITMADGNGNTDIAHLNIIDEASKQKIKTRIMSKIKTPSKKNRWAKAVLAASVILFIITAFISPFGQKTLADILGKLYFIPGSGKASLDNSEDVYILPKPIDVACSGGLVTIHTITKTADSVVIYATSDIGINSNTMTLQAKGINYKFDNAVFSAGDNFTAMYSFTLPVEVNTFTMNFYGKYSIPISLKKADSYDDYEDMGPTDIKNNFGLTLIPTKLDNKMLFELVQHNTNLGSVDYYGISDKEGNSNINISIKDEKNQSYVVNYPLSYAGTQSTFSFLPESDVHSYTVQIPALTLKYDLNDQKVTFPMPKEGETQINKTVDLQGYKVDITKILRKDNQVTVFVDTHYDENRPENPCYFMVNMGKMNLDYYHYQLNDQLTTESIDFYINPDEENLSIYFKELYTISKGPWTFEITNPLNQ
jgi:hypothetical protein